MYYTYCYGGDGEHCDFCSQRARLYRIRAIVSPETGGRLTIARGVIVRACRRCVLHLKARLAREERISGPSGQVD